MDSTKAINVALLGHKDHGKSTLIGRLLYDTKSITEDRIREAQIMSKSLGKEFELCFLLDSFEEEREEGFTLDTTRVQVVHQGVIYDVIDVPGHKELVKNMLTGASLAHAAILIISAKPDEGLQDETKLHIYLSRMLGISKLVIAVNKMDLINYDKAKFDALTSQVTATLVNFGFNAKQLEYVPISAKDGDNVTKKSNKTSWYNGKMIIEYMEEFANYDFEKELSAKPARLIVQDVYNIDSNHVIVGKIESGTFKVKQEVVIEPLSLKGNIEELHVAMDRKDSAHAGQSVGLVIKSDAIKNVTRGCVCMPIKEATSIVTSINARIFCFPTCELTTGEKLNFICAAQEVTGNVELIVDKINPITDKMPIKVNGSGVVSNSQAADVKIKLEKPMILESFSKLPQVGRFVISKNGRIIGVGVVQ